MTISDDSRDDILRSLRVGCTLDVAAKASRTTERACRDLAATDEGWAADLAAAEREGDEARAATATAQSASVPAEEPPPWDDVIAFSAELDAAPAVPAKSTRASKARVEGTAVDRDSDPEIGDSSGQVEPMVDADGAIDWIKIQHDAERDFGPGPFGLLMWQEERLIARGFPRMGDWWLWTLENFYSSLKRWLLVMAGRGMGKSTCLTRLAANEGLFTVRRIPPGQTWIWPFVSVRPSDAKRRLHEIQAILMHAYHFSDKTAKITSPEGTPTMNLRDARSQSIGFVSFASTLGNVSGPNSIGATVDEEEKIERDTSEIVGSLIQTFRARPGIRGVRCSSAMSVRGGLARSIAAGDNLTNFVARIGQRFLPDAIEGFLAVAEWEEAHANSTGAAQIRAYVATLTAESSGIPTWVGNPMYGPNPAARAVALRIEVEGLPVDPDGLTKTRLWLREVGSYPTGEDAAAENDTDFEVLGVEHRYGDEMRERSYGR